MTEYLKAAYRSTGKENIEALIEYLRKLGGKALTLACRRQNAFKIKWAKRDSKLLIRCHIQNAVEYLMSIKADCTPAQVKVLIADIAKYVAILDVNEDISFILISTNTLPSAVHFDVAKRLFYSHQIRPQNQNNYQTDLLTIYALRMSLESRVRGLLGIDYATSRGKSIGLATLIKVSKNLKSVSYTDDFRWTEIEWVNEWLNHYMHRHIRPYPWVIFQALETLQPFLGPIKPLQIEDRVVHSFYSATCVQDENEMAREIEHALKADYPEILIQWHSQREILKL
ncbi:hypothetical protein JAO73_20330 [Hymenobacter sp. BT523]|uniref:hypothetical protein n=1 Tax=Hymenobacter sp. BT523 TaxID=2795725 RepID=UPI0018EC9F68|nr:hypothetical protein [Hymenobacter sp. BT523]MBJ6111379.1 hypothetical protein [Hymenobacter sp. BT523]